MKTKILIILGMVLAATMPLAPQAKAVEFSIAVGDRPYYHGNYYWHEGFRWYWVPGHYSQSRGHWVAGHYVRRGVYNGAYAHTHFRHHRVWIETH